MKTETMHRLVEYRFAQVEHCKCRQESCPARHYFIVEFSLGPRFQVSWWLGRS